MTTTPPAPTKRHPMPFTRLEIVALSLVEGQLAVLLGRRAEAPYQGRWAIPGGVLRIDLDASLDDAARRVASERLKVEVPYLRQLCAVGGRQRDPRSPWALSVVYRGLVRSEEFVAAPGKPPCAKAPRSAAGTR